MPLPPLLQEWTDQALCGSGSVKQPKRGDAIFEGVDYPRTWDGFIGQETAKAQLKVQVASAKARGTRIEHTLLASGMPGVGKSTLATLLAAEAGVGIIQATGPMTMDDFYDLVCGCEDGDIVFIDEIHLLVAGNRNRADWLLPFMTEGKLYGRSGVIEVSDVAVVGATTDAGKLPQTLISRFMVRPVLEAYTEDEAIRIAENLAERMNVPVSGEYFPKIAKASNRNPRDMRMLLTTLRDLMYAEPDMPPDFDTALKWTGLSHDGLGQVAQDILLVLLADDDHTASIDSIQAQLGEPGPLRHSEQVLLQRGLIEITGRGRKLTDAGKRRAIELVQERR